MRQLAPKKCGPVKPLYVSGEVFYASRGLNVLISGDGGKSYELFARCPAPPAERWLSRSRLLVRLGRLGVHSFCPLPGGGAVAVLRKRIVWCADGERQFEEVLRIKRGTRPLNICVTSDGYVYFGEYFNNPDRDSVHVYGSGDGRHWFIAHTFPPGSIRHVHSVVEDPYRGGLWVLTGDSDAESGLWFTSDRFRTLDRVFGGTQRARAVDLIPLKSGLVVPTDTPNEQNYVQWGDPETGELTKITSLPNSAFHAIKQAGLLFISTVAEPSSCNNSTSACVFVSEKGRKWYELVSLPRDWNMIRERHQFVDRVIRHPEIELVPGENDTNFVLAFGRGIRGADGQLLRWSCDRIRNCMDSAQSRDGGAKI